MLAQADHLTGPVGIPRSLLINLVCGPESAELMSQERFVEDEV